MRLRKLQRRKRTDLLWYSLGFVVLQLGLGVGVERFWRNVRDPEFEEIKQIIQDRQAESPGRPLAVVLGFPRNPRATGGSSMSASFC